MGSPPQRAETMGSPPQRAETSGRAEEDWAEAEAQFGTQEEEEAGAEDREEEAEEWDGAEAAAAAVEEAWEQVLRAQRGANRAEPA